MKKTLIGIAALLAIGFIWTQAMAWYGGGHMGYGPQRGSGYYAGPVNDQAHQEFMEQTQDLRRKMAADRVELNTLYSRQNPDQERIRELTARLDENRATIQSLASEKGLARTGRGYRGGPGLGRGHMTGYGGGPGYCWR
ncbi:MAG: Spy/CpxP family protein refolding chaperone [Thermodesulfobacteriota bacterium]